MPASSAAWAMRSFQAATASGLTACMRALEVNVVAAGYSIGQIQSVDVMPDRFGPFTAPARADRVSERGDARASMGKLPSARISPSVMNHWSIPWPKAFSSPHIAPWAMSAAAEATAPLWAVLAPYDPASHQVLRPPENPPHPSLDGCILLGSDRNRIARDRVCTDERSCEVEVHRQGGVEEIVGVAADPDHRRIGLCPGQHGIDNRLAGRALELQTSRAKLHHPVSGRCVPCVQVTRGQDIDHRRDRAGA